VETGAASSESDDLVESYKALALPRVSLVSLLEEESG